jgi:sugar phosphate isomerase/epimerase
VVRNAFDFWKRTFDALAKLNILNTAEEAIAYVKAVGRDNVKVMLDTL